MEEWLNIIFEEEHPEHVQIFISPSLANEKEIVSKSMVSLKSRYGKLIAEANLTDKVRSDTVVLPQGTWIKKSGAANELTEDVITSRGDMAGYYSTTVSIEPV